MIYNGMPPLTAEWSTGATSTGDSLQMELTGLYAGTYSLTLTDDLDINQ